MPAYRDSVHDARPRFSPLPHEHGAYGQVGFPLLTALLAFGARGAALALAGVTVALFLLHEPLQQLLGVRGARARQQHGRAARAWVIALPLVALALLLVAHSVDATWWRWALVPLAALVPVILAIAAGREKSWWGEIAAAVAASSAAIPVAVAAGAPPREAAAVTVPFAVTFALATLAVRVVIARVRGGGDPVEVRRLRTGLACIAGLAGVGLIVAVRAGLPSIALWVTAPGVLAAAALAARPPSPARLRTVGWGLVAISAAQVVLLAARLRGWGG